MLNEGVDIVRPLTDAKGLKLVLDVPERLPILSLDQTRIRQVVLNLLSNAARVTAEGQIVVRAMHNEEELIVQVGDTGPGIPQEELERVFEEFHQVDKTVSLPGSAGLGLAVSKRILELHDGRMWVESTVGKGSTFSFAFPLQESNRSCLISTGPVPPRHLVQPAVVVIGEEESEEVKLLQRHLEEYELVVTSKLEEAVHLVAQIGARAVITNVSADKAIRGVESLPVPLITCPLSSHLRTERATNVDCSIYKPITIQSIREAMRKVAPTASSILIVDDDPSAVRLVERMLQTTESPCHTSRAHSGQEALARIRAQPPDVIVLDLVMPDGDGFWLLSELGQDSAWADIPIIVITGYPGEEASCSKSIGLTMAGGFTSTAILHYLQAILSAVPPAPVERYTSVLPSLEERPA